MKADGSPSTGTKVDNDARYIGGTMVRARTGLKCFREIDEIRSFRLRASSRQRSRMRCSRTVRTARIVLPSLDSPEVVQGGVDKLPSSA